MSIRSASWSSHITLFGCMLLHAFTHGYATMFAPLYLLMKRDMGLPGIKYVTLLITIYGGVYWIFSFAAGIAADRMDRKWLLGVGLLGNSLAILLIGLTHSYSMMIVAVIICGIFGAIFHPAANALAAGHYPESPGMAIGLMGIGSGLGFWFGPQFAGWRASATGSWQRPCVEMSIGGIVVAILFVLLAREVKHSAHALKLQPKMGKELRRKTYLLAVLFVWRDYAGTAVVTLASVFLQKAWKLDTARTGYILGTMMLISIAINPTMVYVSHGKRRLPMLASILILGGMTIALVPWVSLAMVLPVMCVFQAFSLGSYAVGDAALLERVPAHVRGRFTGLFLTIVGTIASTSAWVVGYWTDHMHERANSPHGYVWAFGIVGAMMVMASVATRFVPLLGGKSDDRIDTATAEMLTA